MVYLIITTIVSLALAAWIYQSSISLKSKISWAMVIFWIWLWALVFNVATPELPWLLPAGYFAQDIEIYKALSGTSKLSYDALIFNAVIIIYVGIQLMPMLLMALAGSAYIEASQSRVNTKYIIVLTFFVAGLLFFIVPPSIGWLLITFVHERGEFAGIGKVVLEGLLALCLIAITAGTYGASKSKIPLKNFLTGILTVILLFFFVQFFLALRFFRY